MKFNSLIQLKLDFYDHDHDDDWPAYAVSNAISNIIPDTTFEPAYTNSHLWATDWYLQEVVREQAPGLVQKVYLEEMQWLHSICCRAHASSNTIFNASSNRETWGMQVVVLRVPYAVEQEV